MARRTLTANELRRLAEAVDGVRDEPAYIVWGANGPEVKTSVGKDDDVMAECRTPNKVSGRRSFRSITTDPPIVDATGTPITDIASRYDAMFWSEAAVEKFVLPYLLRYTTPKEVDEFRALYDQQDVAAAVHLPLSNCDLVVSAQAAERRFQVLTPEELRARR